MSKSKRKARLAFLFFFSKQSHGAVYFIALDPDLGILEVRFFRVAQKIVFHSEFSEHGE